MFLTQTIRNTAIRRLSIFVVREGRPLQLASCSRDWPVHFCEEVVNTKRVAARVMRPADHNHRAILPSEVVLGADEGCVEQPHHERRGQNPLRELILGPGRATTVLRSACRHRRSHQQRRCCRHPTQGVIDAGIARIRSSNSPFGLLNLLLLRQFWSS